MLEVGWSELLVIAIILIVVVGPKDLPAMMRTFGRVMGRVRTMANEFRSQFDEAMREADLEDVRKGLGEVNKYNPASSIRDAINPIRQLGQDIKSDLQKASNVTLKPAPDEGTPVAELSSDPVLDPEPAKSEPTTAKPMPPVSAPAMPAAAAAPAVAPDVAAAPVAAPVAADATAPAAKPARSRKAPAKAVAAEAAKDDYPPPAKKTVRRKAPEPHVEHGVRVLSAGEAAPAAIDTSATKKKAAPRKKPAKTGDA
jgi:sec-independent protein translocase protein TatB